MEPKLFESLYPENSWDKELEKVVSYIKEGNSSQLIGLPGVGRSNILGLLAYNRGVRLRHFPKHHGVVHFVMLNFSEVRHRSYIDVLKFIFLCLGNSLRERDMQTEYEKVDTLFKEALSYNDELVLTQHLKNAIEYLSIERKLTVILLCQNFDDYLSQVSDRFFLLLRSIRDRAKYRFFAIFSLARPLEDLLDPSVLADFSDFVVGHTISIPIFDEPSLEFRIHYLEKLVGKKIPAQIKSEVIRLTGGHLRLLIVSLEAVLAELTLHDDLAAFLLKQRSVQTVLGSLWQSFTPQEQAEIVDQKYSQAYLDVVGLIKDNKLCLPLLREAISVGLFKENKATFIYDPASNSIRRGELVFSDSLTKAEFRLLSYLLQHQGEVVERETIISTVWKEDKSSLGISDQAIDQLIFRLRRKIEEDPNQPQILLTIKGRGVKFTQ